MALSTELASYADQPAELAQARALSYSPAEGLELVKFLTEKQLRSHLEALGEVSSDKNVKKAARAAAYKLKSAGVQGGITREAAIDLRVKIEFEQAVAVTIPSLDGRLQMVLPAIPGVAGAELDLREGENPRAEVITEISVGRVRRFQADNGEGKAVHPLLLIDMGLAARIIGLTEQAMIAAKTRIPSGFGNVKTWAERVISFGAIKDEYSARAKLGAIAKPSPEAVSEYASDALIGFLSAPAAAFQLVDAEFRSLLHGSEEISREDFGAQVKTLLEKSAQDWWSKPGNREATALWLEISADIYLAHGVELMARLALGYADELREWAGAPLAHPLLERAFMYAIDVDQAYAHREAHVHGHAHH